MHDVTGKYSETASEEGFLTETEVTAFGTIR